MADTTGTFWVNPFQMLRFGAEEPKKGQGIEYSDVGGIDDKSESGDICGPLSPRPATPNKMSASTRNSRRQSFHPTTDNLAKSPSGVGGYLISDKHAAADATAAVLASLATKDIPSYSTPVKTLSPPSSKIPVDEKPKKRLKRSVSFNGQRPISPRKHHNSNLHIAELLATSVSLVRANNEHLGQLADEYRASDDDERDIEWSDDEGSFSQSVTEEDRQLLKEVQTLSVALQDMDARYTEQLRGKDMLIEELDRAYKKCEKEHKKKKLEIDRLENELDASRQAIKELVERQEREVPKVAQRQEASDTRSVEAVRLLESELREKTKAIEDLNKRLIVSNRRISEAKEKEKKLEAVQQQLQKFHTLESEWHEKQRTLDTLSSQLEALRKREIELHEKDALIETLNIRLDTSQQVIAELREKTAPHDLLRQLRQKDYILDNLTQQVENIDATLKVKDDEIDALTQKLAEESRQLDRLREQNKQLEPLRARSEEAETRVGQLRKQLVEKAKVLSETETKYNESSRVLSESQERVRSQELAITNLRQEVLDLRQSLDTQTAESQEKERSLTTMRDETAHMRSNYQGLLNALSEKDLKIQELDQHIESLQAGLKSASQERDSRITKNEVRLNALQKVLNSKIETCRDYEKKIAELEEEFDGLRKQMENAKSAGSEKELKITRLVKANRELKEEVSMLKEKMEAKEQEIVILKSRIPKPAPGMAPAASERSSTKVRSRPPSFCLAGESSDEDGNSRIRRHASLSGVEASPLRRSASTSSLARRLSDSPRLALSRTKSTANNNTTSNERASPRQTTAASSLSNRHGARPRVASTASTSTAELLRRRTTAGKTEASPINRSAVTQRTRDVKVLTNMLSGVAPERKPRLSTITEGRTTGTTARRASQVQTATTPASRRKSLAQTSDLSANSHATANTKTTTRSATGTSSTKPRASLIRPLPTRKASFSN